MKPFEVLVASMNVGNTAMLQEQLHDWLKGGCDAEVVAIGLQESVESENFYVSNFFFLLHMSEGHCLWYT